MPAVGALLRGDGVVPLGVPSDMASGVRWHTQVSGAEGYRETGGKGPGRTSVRAQHTRHIPRARTHARTHARTQVSGAEG